MRRLRSVKGFSLLEVAIVIGVIAALSITVILGARYLVVDSRRATALKLVDGLRDAARLYSKRERAGLDFASLSWTNPGALVGLKPDSYSTPWGGAVMALQVVNQATAICTAAAGDCASTCGGNTCFRVCVEVPAGECATLQAQVSGALISRCTTTTSAADNCNLAGGSGTWLVVTGR